MPQILREVFSSLGRGLRLAVFRRPADDTSPVRAGTLVTLFGLWLLAIAAAEALLAGDNIAFNSYGLSASLAVFSVFGILLVLVGAGATRVPLSRAAATVLGMQLIVMLPVIGALAADALGYGLPESFAAIIGDRQTAIGVLVFAWLIAGTWWTGRVLWQGELRLPGLRLVAATLLPTVLIPMPPMVYGSDTDWSRIDVWHHAAEARKWLGSDATKAAAAKRPRRPRIDVEAAYYRQPALVKAALDDLKPSPPDRPQIYFVAAAAYSGQDVFKREVEGARAILDARFGTAGRSIALVNYRDTLGTLPLANATNLALVLDGIAKIMNRDKDILVLFITTHGSKGLLAVDFPGFSLNNLTPQRLAAILKSSGIRNKVLIISACHSGSFIPALVGNDTLVMAAAHAEKTSFGCESGREWTYFGDALFNRALRSTYSFTDAFEAARAKIEEWEKKDDLVPSEPQIIVGSGIRAPLAALTASLQKQAGELKPTP